eukprot:1175956-Prorocentrum_minimum.AAC.2
MRFSPVVSWLTKGRGAFDLGATVHPIAIKYNKIFVDAFWNSRRQSFTQHLMRLMTSWAVVCDVWCGPVHELYVSKRREAILCEREAPPKREPVANVRTAPLLSNKKITNLSLRGDSGTSLSGLAARLVYASGLSQGARRLDAGTWSRRTFRRTRPPRRSRSGSKA